jgi:rhamnosyltransferase
MPYSKTNVAGVVVLYNSPAGVIQNIASYVDQIDKLFVIDNSEQEDLSRNHLIKSSFENIHYEWNGGNKGVAFALNRGARLAIQSGYKFLLTMDDDSATPPLMIHNMLNFINTNETKPLGLLAPNYTKDNDNEEEFQSVLFTITSGNLLMLDVYLNIGGFRDDFFIDHIDNDYCLRLNRSNYLVIRMNRVNLTHKIGTRQKMLLFERKVMVHNRQRLYYYTRNGLVLLKKWGLTYPSFLRHYIRYTLLNVLKIFLFRKYRGGFFYLSRGFFDGATSKMGAWDSKSSFSFFKASR